MDKVLVIDFGSQYCRLIARIIRELNVESYVLPADDKDIVSKAKKFNAIIMSGGPDSVYDKNSLTIDKEIFNLNIPILGTCYGMQIIHHLLGGEVKKLKEGEFGKVVLKNYSYNPIIKSVKDNSFVWMSHFDSVVKLAPGFKTISKTKICNAITSNDKLKIYTTQFHPEVSNTEFGKQIISNFLFEICKLQKEWKVSNFSKEIIETTRKKLKNSKTILALSGGVDSSVVCMILHKAIGDNLIPVFIDNGLLRKNEAEYIFDLFKNKLKINITIVDAKDNFYKALKNVVEPEKKRKIIGKVFIEEFTKIQNKNKDAEFLAQGTIYPDIIESSNISSISHTIKSHHNVGGLPEEMNFQIIEPIKFLFKDEVRELGLQLGLPREIIERHPFPGPGLGIRIIGEITKEKVKILQEVDYIFISNLKKYNLYKEVAQAAAILTPIKTVGVQGDMRTYTNLVALRAVKTNDFMTASFSRLDFNFLDYVSTEIINKVSGVNRVVYDITSKPPGTIEWE